MKAIIIIIGIVIMTPDSIGQPNKSFFVVHCDPNESYNYPNLMNFVDSANKYNIKLTIEFTAPWVDSILPFPSRLNKIAAWQFQGHEIGIHHHEINAHGLWDGYSNCSMIEIQNAGRDTSDFIGSMDSLYHFVQQITPIPIRTIGLEDSSEMPTQVQNQTTGYEIYHGFSNPYSYSYNGNQYCKTSHCFISDQLKEQQLENIYPTKNNFQVLGANCHVHNFVSNPFSIISFFQFINQTGIMSMTVNDIIQDDCAVSSTEPPDNTKGIHIHPNPVSDMVTVSFDDKNCNPKNIKIYNSSGQQIKHYSTLSYVFTIKTDSWQNGVYFILVQTDNTELIIEKIIKK